MLQNLILKRLQSNTERIKKIKDILKRFITMANLLMITMIMAIRAMDIMDQNLFIIQIKNLQKTMKNSL
ncbi:MAG: hypothetical protein EB010_11575 [Acidimicrobiia bacterium]|nr:hypothetical protein [Acidimicrobiia bacterium]NDE81292.1 hypothetical protein [Actinomycetota bacterium]